MDPGSDTQRLTLRGRLVSACLRFERSWLEGGRPRAEDVLADVPEGRRAEFLRNLLEVELELRRRAGERPAVGDYLDRFPGYREAVEAARDGQTELQLCERALNRRLKGKALAPTGAGKEGRALARLGYGEDVISRTLERALRGRTEE